MPNKNEIVKIITEPDYTSLLEELRKNIKGTRISLARRINEGVIHLYWNIGKSISERKITEGYGSAVIKRLSADLKKEFPEMGFSERNLWDMTRMYSRFSIADQKLRQVVAVLPWGHILLLMNKLSTEEAMLYYAEQAVTLGWSRNVLLNYIKADAYGNMHNLPKQHNFNEVLPEHLQEQANEILKSRYNLSFLGVEKPLKEIELEKMLVEKIRFFILELGKGFSFVGNQYRLTLNNKEYFVDMLFFNRCTKSLVAVELKIGEFKPEYISKMGFYLSLLDKQARMDGENPSIGIILCADKDNDEVEIALQTASAPIGVADYNIVFPENKIKQLILEEFKNRKIK
ncbi:MAG: DUF1016 family protein [Bacteroidales bacterium]|nr:DUF1016 family protein [Bacteroidales bacterium]